MTFSGDYDHFVYMDGDYTEYMEETNCVPVPALIPYKNVEKPRYISNLKTIEEGDEEYFDEEKNGWEFYASNTIGIICTICVIMFF